MSRIGRHTLLTALAVCLLGLSAVAGPEPETGPTGLAKGEFSFHYEQGWSFEKNRIVPVDEADVVFETCAGGISSVTLRAPGGITNLAKLRDGTDPAFPAAVFDALVGANRDVPLGPKAHGDSRFAWSDVFVLRTRKGHWVKLAIVERAEGGSWQKRPVTIRYVSNPKEPAFGPAAGARAYGAFSIDETVLARREAEEARAARDRHERHPVTVKLRELDERARTIERRLSTRLGKPAHVAAVVSRRWARSLAYGDDHAYTAATFSFEHATRDDRAGTRNDWDFEYGNGEGDSLHLHMVTDDRGRLFDLGRTTLDEVGVDDPSRFAGRERIEAREGRVLAIHTLDSETDQWALLEVLEREPGRCIVFRWEVLDPPGAFENLGRVMPRILATPRVRLQIRCGRTRGSFIRVYLDGSASHRVGEVSPDPIDLTKVPGMHEPSQAHAEGGLVPPGMVFRIDSVKATARADGHTGRRGRFRLVVGPFEVAHLWRDPDVKEEVRVLTTISGHRAILEPTETARVVLSGPFWVRPGEERLIYAEVEDSSLAEVVLEGEFVPVADAPPGLPAVYSKAGVVRDLNEFLRLLPDPNPGRAAFGARGFEKNGSLSLPWLEAVLPLRMPGPARERIAERIEKIRKALAEEGR